MNSFDFNTCKECPFHKGNICHITETRTSDFVICAITRYSITTEGALKVLHHFQKWRKGADIGQPNSTVLGAAMDKAINVLRKYKRRTR